MAPRPPTTGCCPECGSRLKHCPQCDQVLSADKFTRSKTSATGLSCWCRACQKAHRDDPERKARQAVLNRAHRVTRRQQRSESLEERLAAIERAIREPEDP